MGGDSFEGAQKLTNEQYTKLISEIIEILKDVYVRVEPYISLPEKTVHGDIDFLMILKKEVTLNTIAELLKPEKYKISHQYFINMLYKKKQVEFKIASSQQEFQMIKFYKSYSGLGGFLGIFLPSHEVKLTEKGLFAVVIKQHVKFQYLITDLPNQILKFYGLDYDIYKQGFKRRVQIFEYMYKCKFLNPQQFHLHVYRDEPKLTKLLKQYLKQRPHLDQRDPVVLKNPLKDTLDYFNKYADFQQRFQQMTKYEKRKQNANKKFNGYHIINQFQVIPKQVDKAKSEFKQWFKSEQEYLSYIQEKELDVILKKLSEVVCLQKFKKQQDKEEREKKWKMFKTVKKEKDMSKKQEQDK